jgi:predicted HAD superfamily Cof-like phosphohydrolase
MDDLSRAGRTDLLRIIEELKDESDRKDRQITELQSRMSEMVNNSLSRRVRAFHLKFGHPVAWTPAVPDEKQVKFRLKLITEEFFELLAACEIWPHTQVEEPEGGTREIRAHEMVLNAIEYDFIDPKVINLPEFADALADLDYVIEGTRAVFGVNGGPIMDEVQRANMAKEAADVAAADAAKRGERIKPMKPAGWTPPDVAGELAKQGWQP